MDFENEEHELACFEDIFLRDIEKGWNADHFYCDHCYDDFIREWPLAYSARNAEFQCAGIDLDTFFSGSRLSKYFLLEDFRRLIVQLQCPNCRNNLGGNIWPYHLPFDVPYGFDQEVEEISELAKKAPFLLLAHPLSNKVFELIKRLTGSAVSKPIHERLYRARKLDSKIAKKVEEFDFPPAQYVGDGRYNHSGRPVLYIASTAMTCVSEMRNVNCLIMGFQLDSPLKILDLVDLDTYAEEDQEQLVTLSYSALVSAPSAGSDWDKAAYVFTRFLADCAAFAGFDAIKYPSTRLGAQDGSYNLVLMNRSLKLEGNVSQVEYTEHIATSK